MGRQDFNQWRLRHNRLRFILSEAAWAAFVWKGRNHYIFNRLFLVASGSGSIVNHATGQCLAMRSGSAYFLPQHLDLSFDFRPGLGFWSFHFNVELLPGLDLFHQCRDCRETALAPGELAEVSGLLNTAPECWRDLARLELLLFELLERHTPAAELSWPQLPELEVEYAGLLDFIRRQATAKTTLKELARAAGMTPDGLSRRFTRDFGIPVKQFLGRELLRRAMTIMEDRGRTLKEVADQLGFANEFYFSRFFKRHIGTPPGQHRQLHR